MMKTRPSINRASHAGKSSYEKAAYENFLRSKFPLDKTEEEPVDLDKTNSSSFEEENFEKVELQPKSLRLRIKDFFSQSFWVTIITGIILLVIGGIGSIIWSQATTSEKVLNIERDVQKIVTDHQQTKEQIGVLDKSLSILKAEINKDIEFIKKKLKF